tara:strand:- start:11034 stop:11567 length:534 start_codon:yes stop_codon:yes gene_type:complete
MTKLKTINIKGKEYVEVNERLIYFRKNFPNFSLTSEVLEKTDKSILILATISNDEGKVIATGMAEEERGSTFINKTSYVENCETSAWGRALANFGIGLETSVASADEVQNAIAQQEEKPKNILLDINEEKMEDVLRYVVDNKTKGLQWIVDNISTKYNVTTKVKNKIKKTLQDGIKK